MKVISGAGQTQEDIRTLAKAQPNIESALSKAEEGAKTYAAAQLTLQFISTISIASIALMAIHKCINGKKS